LAGYSDRRAPEWLPPRYPRAGSMGVRTVVVALLSTASAFYLPGIAPHEYADGERVEIKVNQLSSTKTQMPYDYYSLPFCKPTETVSAVENLGEVLHGSVIQNSPYDIFMGKTDFKVLCRVELTPKTSALLAKRIKEDYRVHLIMDNLPAATKMIREMPDGKQITMYDRGYPLGFIGSVERPGELLPGATPSLLKRPQQPLAARRPRSSYPCPAPAPRGGHPLPAPLFPTSPHTLPHALAHAHHAAVARWPRLGRGHALPVQPPALRRQVPQGGLLCRRARGGLRGAPPRRPPPPSPPPHTSPHTPPHTPHPPSHLTPPHTLTPTLTPRSPHSRPTPLPPPPPPHTAPPRAGGAPLGQASVQGQVHHGHEQPQSAHCAGGPRPAAAARGRQEGGRQRARGRLHLRRQVGVQRDQASSHVRRRPAACRQRPVASGLSPAACGQRTAACGQQPAASGRARVPGAECLARAAAPPR
jgi:hypothetical protein